MTGHDSKQQFSEHRSLFHLEFHVTGITNDVQIEILTHCFFTNIYIELRKYFHFYQ